MRHYNLQFNVSMSIISLYLLYVCLTTSVCLYRVSHIVSGRRVCVYINVPEHVAVVMCQRLAAEDLCAVQMCVTFVHMLFGVFALTHIHL